MSTHRNARQSRLPKILVTDDEPQIRELFLEILAPDRDADLIPGDELSSRLFGASREIEEAEYEVITRSQGEEAVEAVEKAMAENEPFAVVFLDVRMPPGRGGVWAAERIRRLDHYCQIVFITAFTDLDPAEIAKKAPPEDRLLYLQKPFHAQEIRHFAASLVAKWRAEKDKMYLQTRLEAMVGERTMELAASNEALKQEMEERGKVADMISTAKKEWESTFDSVQDPIVILDKRRRIRRLNVATAHRLGVEPRAVVGKPASFVFDSPEKPGERSKQVTAMADGRHHSMELAVPRLRGEFIITASPMHLGDGRTAGTVFVAHDVTERKGLERRLRQSHKMEAIGTLAGGIAHDFNNILGIIMGFSEMSLEETEKGSNLERRLNHVLEACRRAKDLVQQILTFSRQSDQELKHLAVTPLVKETMKLIRATLPNNIAIEEAIVPGRDLVRADPTQIQQIVMNLCGNAAHAMRGKGGTLRISLNDVNLPGGPAPPALKRGPYVKLSVEDTGHGIPKDIIDRIFDPFFTTKKPGEGTGMGLSVIHGIIKDYKGAVTVKSVEGRGSVFDVYLPRDESPQEEDDESAPPDTPGEGRILFVDDESALTEIGRELLEGMGYSVTAESDSERALALFKKHPAKFRMVITDQSMPGLSGAELAEKILTVRPDTPIILCTGFSETLTREKAMEIGVGELLLKPILKKDLMETVNRLLRGKDNAQPGKTADAPESARRTT